MNKTLAHHQILCEYINRHYVVECTDTGISAIDREEQSAIGVCRRVNSKGTWSICLISSIKRYPFCRTYTPVYEGLNSAMANILLDYARKIYQVEEKNIDNNQLLPQN